MIFKTDLYTLTLYNSAELFCMIRRQAKSLSFLSLVRQNHIFLTPRVRQNNLFLEKKVRHYFEKSCMNPANVLNDSIKSGYFPESLKLSPSGLAYH